MVTHQLIVLSNPVADRDDEYNEWYEHTHLDEVLKVPGFVAAQRFSVSLPRGEPQWRYAAAYDIETDDPLNTIRTLRETIPTMNMSDSIDGATTAMWILQPIGDRHTSR